MAINGTILFHLFLLQWVSCFCLVRSYDFFYFVQMWPGSYCHTRRGCCYPKTGKPAPDFSIHGLWPHYNNNSFATDCNSRSPFNETQVSDLIGKMEKSWPTFLCAKKGAKRFWSHEWTKHGTCSENVLDQHAYFAAALNVKDKVDLLGILENAGIKPDGSFYKVDDIKAAIKGGIGHVPVIECNSDASGNIQLYQVYVCVDAAASQTIECPLLPQRNCTPTIKFPPY